MPNKSYYFLGLFLVVIFLIVCQSSQTKKIYQHDFLAMGTYFSIKIVENHPVEAGHARPLREILSFCEERVRTLETVGNLFNPQSEISKINSASGKWHKVSQDLFKVLKISKAGFEKSKGVFDITVQVQNSEPVQKLIGFQKIKLNPPNKIYLPKNMQIDLSGVLKGYAVDEIVVILKQNKIEHALINGGGNIYALGKNEKEKPWKIGLRDPNNKNKIIKKISLTNQAVATSAGYERFIKKEEKKYSHIIDPRTGQLIPAQGSVSAIASTAVEADMYSTAGFVERELEIAGIKFLRVL